jgi:outer membrane receptor protein involved in Fe transport
MIMEPEMDRSDRHYLQENRSRMTLKDLLMQKTFLVFIIIVIAQQAAAQKFSVKGEVLDTLNNPLPSATVLLMNAADSTLVNFGVSDTNGMFELKAIDPKEYLFKITFIGYRTYTRKISPPDTGDILNLGTINMETEQSELGEVVVQAEQIPVMVKKDTIEYHAGSFKTKPNDNVESLLKKLPGVEVDHEGTVTAQGEQVERVTVDGKEFFGRDPKLATRNLPADAVDKVQVFNKKSDQVEFTGIDDGQREKTINLELKEERRNSTFGNLTAGAGTDDRFQSKTNMNRFDKRQQLSFLGMANNTNEQGFSIDEYMDFTGASQQMTAARGPVRVQVKADDQTGIPLNRGNRTNGIMTNYAGGLNFNREFNGKTELNGNYFFNSLDHDITRETVRENFLPGGNFSYIQNSVQQNTNRNHRLNVLLDHQFDPLNSIKFTSGFTSNKTGTEQQSTSENRSADNTVQNESDILNTADGNSMTWNSSLLFRHRFAKKGRTLSSTLIFGISQNDRDDFTDGIYRYFGDEPTEEIQKQVSRQAVDNLNVGSNVIYTEPLGGRKYLEFNYSFNRTANDVNRDVYDLTNGEEVFDPELSTLYNSRYIWHRGGLNFRLNSGRFNLQAGGSLQYTDLSGELESTGTDIGQTFRNMLPMVHFNYDFTSSKHLRFDYETSVQEPTVQQLNPALDQTDRLNLYQGNPGLRPAYSHSWRLSFDMFNPIKMMSFFSFLHVNYTTNAITNSITNDNFVRLTMPVNVDDNLNMNGNATIFFPVSAINSKFSLSAKGTEQHYVNVLDGVENKIRQRTLGAAFRYDYRCNDFFDLNLSVDLSKQETRYEFDEPDQTFFNQTYTAGSNLIFFKNYQLSAGFNYYVYTSKSTDFNESIPVLDLSVSRFLMKNKGELKFSVSNLLDQELGVTQTASNNYMERQTTNSLGRYFMLSFTYAINKLLDHTRPPKGMIKMMR